MSLPCHYFLVNQHLTLVRETDIMRTIALRKSPPELCKVAGADLSTQSAEMQRCRVAHNLPPYLPSGLIRMRIEQIRESPLGLDPRAAELPICMVC